jgi:hypothetical protein
MRCVSKGREKRKEKGKRREREGKEKGKRKEREGKGKVGREDSLRELGDI